MIIETIAIVVMLSVNVGLYLWLAKMDRQYTLAYMEAKYDY